MDHNDLQKPQDWEYYKKFYGYKDTSTDLISHVTGVLAASVMGGLLIGVVLMAFGGRGKDVSFMPFFLMGAVISAVGFFMISSGNVSYETELKNKRNALIKEMYDAAWAKYNAEIARREAAERERREAMEKWKREAPERERQEALKRAEEEKARQEQERAYALRQRQAAFEQATMWARGALETAYQDVAMQLAAEEGILDQRDILKVFAAVYPRLPIAEDNRMGCLRAYIGKDERITAIQRFLPPQNAENTYPT